MTQTYKKNGHMGLLLGKEIILHMLFWLMYLLFPFLKSMSRPDYSYHLLSEMNDLGFALIIFYTTYLMVFPNTGRTFKFVLLSLFSLFISFVNFKIHNYIFHGSHEEAFSFYLLGYISKYTVLILFAYVLYSTKKSYHHKRQMEEAIYQKERSELITLRSQINPHFLFNTLNTIYCSTLNREEEAPELVLKLSDNFRYLLEEGKEEFVPIGKEISHLKGYISLQSKRLKNQLDVDLSIDIDDNEVEIAPLLIQPFIENAFKYFGSSKDYGNTIFIVMNLEEGKFRFSCLNPFNGYAGKLEDGEERGTGIGIRTTEHRLKYIYPDKHKLTIKKTSQKYMVELIIRL